ncbi:MAG TPA: hypothetical protein VMW62_00935, partial [Chloroflexota bacterium]|nr:hypothetical protein [Chloroflexota bacterium]
WYGPRHFLPERKMAAALQQGPGCVVFTGDSRVQAALEPAVVRDTLAAHNVTACVADLSMGGVGIDGQAAAIRHYLARTRPRMIVVGLAVATLLRPTQEPDPGDLIGSNAVSLLWAKPGDAARRYPDASSLAQLDQRARFLLAASMPLGIYEWRLWFDAQQLQARIAAQPKRPVNQFGAFDDMVNFALELSGATKDRFDALARSGIPIDWQRQQDPFFTMLEQDLAGDRVPLVLVRVPMVSSMRQAVATSAVMGDYLTYLSKSHPVLDLSALPGLPDAGLPDNLHVSKAGAKLFSTTVAEQLAPLLARTDSS